MIVLCSWLFRVIKGKNNGAFDEKQKYDLAKAGTTAWLLSLPAMLVLFILNFNNVQGLGSILWFPFYIYVTLFIFSASSLFYYKGT